MSKIFNFVINGRRAFALVAMLLTTAVAAFAQDIKVTIDNFEIAAGETTTVNINVENTVACGQTFTGDIYLPEGLVPTPTQQTSGGLPVYVTKTTRFSKSHTASSATANENPNLVPEDGEGSMIRFSVTSLSGKTLAPGEGAVLTISVTAEKGYEKAPGKIELKDATITDDKGKIVSVKATGYVNAAISLDAFDVEATPNQESVVTIFMNNQAIIAGLDAVITLPEGLTFVENDDEEYCTEADRTSMHVVSGVVNAKTPNVMKVLISAMPPVNIDGEEGAIFSFIVKGDAKLAETSEITITKVHASSLRGEKYDIPDLTISVTNPDAAAAATIDEEVKALKDEFAAAQEALKEYDEDIQEAAKADVEAIGAAIEALEQAVAEAKANGTLAADLDELEEEIDDISYDIDDMLDDADEAQEAKEAAAAKEAEDAQYAENVAAVAALRKALGEANAAAKNAGLDPTADAKAASDAINDFSAKVEANHAANKSVEAAEELGKSQEAAQGKVDGIQEAAKKANDAQAAKDNEAIAAAEKALSDAKAAIAEYDEEVQEGAADAVAAAEKALADAKAAAEKSAQDGTSVIDAAANAKAIEAAKAAAEKAAADAKAAQEAADAAKTAAEQNEAQNKKDNAAVADAQKALDDAKAAIAKYDQSVQDGAKDAIEAAQKAIDDAKAAADASYEAGTAVADAEANKKAIDDAKAAAEKVAADAAEAQKAWEEAQKPKYEKATIADGDYYIKNVESGLFLTGSNSWGTQASLGKAGMLFTVTALENGGYSLLSSVIAVNNKYLGSNLYVDSTTPEGGFEFYNVDGAIAIALGNKFLAKGDDGQTFDPMIVAVDEVNATAKWQILSKEEALKTLEAASADAPVDATFLISNPGFNRNTSTDAWTVSEDCTNKNLSGGDNDFRAAESWRSVFTISQTIDNIPNGLYEVTVNAALTDYTDAYDGAEYPVVFANDETAVFNNMEEGDRGTNMTQLAKAFANGNYLVGPISVEVTDGTLTIGVKGTRTDTWCIWDNFQMKYLGEASGEPKAPKVATTTLVTDGSVAQYLYNVEAKAFFLGANDWGTRASVSAEQGYPVKITVNADGETYTLNDQRTDGSWHSADCQGVDQIWIDGENRAGDKMWTVAFLNNGSFTLANTNVPEGGNLSVVPSKGDTRLYLSTEDEAQDIWAAVSEEEYAKYVEAYAKYEEELEEYNKNNYKVGDDITNLAPGAWDGQTGSYGGLGRTAYERYSGAGSIEAGDVLTQTLTGLKNGTYEVSLGLAASYTSGRGFECPTGEYRAVAFANGDEEDLEVVDRTWVAGGEEETVDLIAVVTDGTLKYGIKNILKGGNWYVATVNSIKYVSEDAAVPALVDLTADMFKHWTAADATGEVEGAAGCAYEIGTSSSMPYGDGNVSYLNYADLSDCSSIVVVATEGEPRLLFNRVVDQGTVNVELPRDAATYETVIDNEDGSKTYIVDVAKIVAEYGFAHLHAIKGANWQNTTVTSIQLEKMVTPTYFTSIGYTRTAGLGYTAEEVPYNEEEIFNALGVTSWEGVEMYPVVMTAGEIGEDHDGWRNVDGDPAAWTGDGTDLGLCLKYPHDGSFALCTHPNNDPEAGTLLAAAWALKAGEKTATIRVVVEFVAPEVVDIEIAENMIQASVEYDNTEASYVEKSVTLSDDDVAAILSELDLESLDDADVYGYNPTTKELVSSFTGYDGWRDANGDFANWTGDSSVPACVKYTDGQTYLCYNINGCDPQTIKTYWAIANDTKAVLVEISFTYTGAVKIADIEKAGSVKNGKFLEDGKVVIYKNGVKYNAAGYRVK